MSKRKLITIADLKKRNNTGSTKNGWFIREKIPYDVNSVWAIRDVGLTCYWYKGRAWYKDNSKGFDDPSRNTTFNNYFKDWQNPTKTEVEMFEILTGFKYITYYLNIDEESLPER